MLLLHFQEKQISPKWGFKQSPWIDIHILKQSIQTQVLIRRGNEIELFPHGVVDLLCSFCSIPQNQSGVVITCAFNIVPVVFYTTCHIASKFKRTILLSMFTHLTVALYFLLIWLLNLLLEFCHSSYMDFSNFFNWNAAVLNVDDTSP